MRRHLATAAGWAKNHSANRGIPVIVGPMRPDAEKLVEANYDQIAQRYLDWISQAEDDPRLRYLNEVLKRLTARPVALDLGCGAGVPCTAMLAERGEATGVDISGTQIALARRNVPNARFIKSSMAAITFPPDSFDLVTAFYSIPHLPRTQHADLLRRISVWLRPGGILLATFGEAEKDTVAEFLETQMPTSSYHPKTNRRMVLDTGLTVLTDETFTFYNGQVDYQWMIAGKGPVEASGRSYG